MNRKRKRIKSVPELGGEGRYMKPMAYVGNAREGPRPKKRSCFRRRKCENTIGWKNN
jgi:hypothetical protein